MDVKAILGYILQGRGWCLFELRTCKLKMETAEICTPTQFSTRGGEGRRVEARRGESRHKLPRTRKHYLFITLSIADLADFCRTRYFSLLHAPLVHLLLWLPRKFQLTQARKATVRKLLSSYTSTTATCSISIGEERLFLCENIHPVWIGGTRRTRCEAPRVGVDTKGFSTCKRKRSEARLCSLCICTSLPCASDPCSVHVIQAPG
jgi:hypothetical protein